MKKIMIIAVVIFLSSFVAANVLAITIKDKTLTQIQYSILKNDLIDKYKTQGFFTVNEWQTYMAVLNYEAKQKVLSRIKISGNLHNNLMDKIYAK